MGKKSKPPKNAKQPFLSFGYWYDSAFAPSKPKPPKKPKK